MPEIQNITSLQRKLENLRTRYTGSGTPSVVVGYTANYAVYVHERPAIHNPGQQWKFLEQPARELGGMMGNMLSEALASGVKLLQALYLLGMRLQRESQEIVPIDTGNLRASAFTAREDDLQSVMAASEGKLLESMQKQAEKHAKKMAKNVVKRNKAKERRAKQKASAAGKAKNR